MVKSSKNALTKKKYFQLAEVEKFYKMINKYNLRQTAYKKLLQLYIKFIKTQKSNK